MSSHTPSNEPHGKQSEDEVDYFKVILVGVVSLVIFALSTVWAAIILNQETARVQEQTGASPAPIHGAKEIGIVDQVPFSVDRRLLRYKKERAQLLNSYGWADRGKGLARIPIDKAMDAIASGALPVGAPK